MAYTSFTDLVNATLRAVNELADGTSGWQTEVEEIVVRQHRRLIAFCAWSCLEQYPPATIIVPASITDATVTIAAGGTAGTFGGPAANYAATKLGWKFWPDGEDYSIRISAHTAAAAAFTSPGAPETLTAAAGKLFQDEHSLPSDVNFLLNAGWTNAGSPIDLKNDETLREDYGNPTAFGWPPVLGVRLGKSRVRFSHVPTDGKKLVEIPYTYDPGDPSGASAMTIEEYLRTLLAQMCLGPALRLKRGFAQANTEETLALRQMDDAKKTEEDRRRAILGNRSSAQRRSAYA